MSSLKMTSKGSLKVAAALAGAGVLNSVGWCAEGEAPPGSAAIEEVVVTAEKRESTVQKTPISITAIRVFPACCPSPSRSPACPSKPPVPVRPNSRCAA
jgi:hypothetical protein